VRVRVFGVGVMDWFCVKLAGRVGHSPLEARVGHYFFFD
jgi:hypothetical protein